MATTRQRSSSHLSTPLRVFVSIASIPQRLHLVDRTVRCFSHQHDPPEKILLVLPHTAAHLALPSLRHLFREEGELAGLFAAERCEACAAFRRELSELQKARERAEAKRAKAEASTVVAADVVPASLEPSTPTSICLPAEEEDSVVQEEGGPEKVHRQKQWAEDQAEQQEEG